ncbi:Pycsar system effector family protein [Erythrobacter mangrovi]|uniref:Pycsar system effector family protein n=1 Tax=Erythrobacter mangrovi TaxID=2739433 RepID=UPI001F37B4C6|nr:Pycsar system effector family protein [Erythrobacter mangrovi]
MSDSARAEPIVADESDTAAAPISKTYSNQAIHLMRTAQMSTLKLSQMADQKASILLGATFLVFSLSVSRALSGGMPISLMILAGFSFASSLCAVMAVLPKVGRPTGKIKNANLLFFGHFTWMDEEEWQDQLLERLETDETVFRTMAHDMYQNGQVLAGKKYRFLALAYKMFMTGLFLTLTVFAIETLLS